MKNPWTDPEKGFHEGPIPWNPTRPEQVKVLLALAEAHAPKRVLDAGCGPGYMSRALLDRLPGLELVAFDFSEHMVEMARRHLGARRVLRCDLGEDWGALGNGFDMVLAVQSVHHLDDAGKQRAVASAFAALAPGGLFVVSDPVAFESFEAVLALLNHSRIAAGFEPLPDGFDEAAFDEVLEQNGDRLAPLGLQMGWMRETGFTRVECFWRYGNRAIFGGTRPCTA